VMCLIIALYHAWLTLHCH